jgi:hypothetical protein
VDFFQIQGARLEWIEIRDRGATQKSEKKTAAKTAEVSDRISINANISFCMDIPEKGRMRLPQGDWQEIEQALMGADFSILDRQAS